MSLSEGDEINEELNLKGAKEMRDKGYNLQIYENKTDTLLDEIPLGSKIPKQFKGLKVRSLR